MDIQEIKNIPKPYKAKLSEKYSGVDIIYDDFVLFTIPLFHSFLYKTFIGALNGAFFEGYIYREKMSKK